MTLCRAICFIAIICLCLSISTIVVSQQYQLIENNYLSIVYFDTESYMYAFFDKSSGFLSNAQYDDIYDYLCQQIDMPICVWQSENYGYANRSTGKLVILCVYNVQNTYMEFRNGYALVGLTNGNDTDYHLINTKGEYVDFPNGIIPYGWVSNESTVRVYSRDEFTQLYGLYNLDNGLILPVKYEYISDFVNGYACIRKDGLIGHIDESGCILVEPRYALETHGQMAVYYFDQNGFASFTTKDGCLHIIDCTGYEFPITNRTIPVVPDI